MSNAACRKVLVVFPNPPVTIDGGAQMRCIQIVRGLLRSGHRVRLVHPGRPAGGLLQFADTGLDFETRSLSLTWSDDAFGGVRARFAACLTGRPRIGRSAFYSPWARAWFADQLREFEPDAVWTVYLYAHRLVEQRRASGGPLWVLDALDLSTKHQAIYRASVELVGPESGPVRLVADSDLREDYYDDPRFDADPEEFRLIGTYPATAAISPIEARVIAEAVPGTRVNYLPLTCQVPEADGPHDGQHLAVLQYHPIILHCYLYFVRRVLPLIRQAVPGFRLRVVGGGSERFPPADGIDLIGYVPDLDAELAHAPFLVLPVFGMTGQQTRIVLAMSRGVPVVTLRMAAEAAGVVHMVNGMVADKAEDLAAHVVYLCGRPDECRRLGAAARQTAETEFSDRQLLAAIEAVLGTTASA